MCTDNVTNNRSFSRWDNVKSSWQWYTHLVQTVPWNGLDKDVSLNASLIRAYFADWRWPSRGSKRRPCRNSRRPCEIPRGQLQNTVPELHSGRTDRAGRSDCGICQPFELRWVTTPEEIRSQSKWHGDDGRKALHQLRLLKFPGELDVQLQQQDFYIE